MIQRKSTNPYESVMTSSGGFKARAKKAHYLLGYTRSRPVSPLSAASSRGHICFHLLGFPSLNAAEGGKRVKWSLTMVDASGGLLVVLLCIALEFAYVCVHII